MTKPKILLQLDPDAHASVFDAVVAIDSQVDRLLQYAGVRPEQVAGLVHGCIFTRSPADLSQTAIFLGGSNVAAAEALLAAAKKAFFGPMRVSILLDANGANTTAAAAVLAAAKHVELNGATAVVLAGTGPVGQRAARLLARQGAKVRLGSRQAEKAAAVALQIKQHVSGAEITGGSDPAELLQDAQIVIAAGAAGAELLPLEVRRQTTSLKVAIDLNAVPPAGIAGVEVMDKAAERDGVIAYGAIGVGGTKMKIHRAAIAKLFTRNDLILDAEQIFDLGSEI